MTPTSSLEDILKCKTKHLRSYLNAKNIPTQTCKEKRELAELIIKSLVRPATSSTGIPTEAPPLYRPQQSQQPFNTTESQQQRPNRNFNDTLSSFMNNVQEFVNFNVNNAFVNPNNANMPNTRPTNSHRTFTNQTGTTTTTSTSNSQPQSSRSFTTSINDLFSIINDNVPPVVQQTFTNNRFTFNNVFNQPPQQQQQQTSSTTTNNYTGERRPSTSSSNGSLLDEYEVIGNDESTQQRNSSSSSTAANATNSTPPTTNLKRRASISDLRNLNDIDSLSIRQMKEILASNFVEYKGRPEHWFYLEKVILGLEFNFPVQTSSINTF
jgi:hypothetical protein